MTFGALASQVEFEQIANDGIFSDTSIRYVFDESELLSWADADELCRSYSNLPAHFLDKDMLEHVIETDSRVDGKWVGYFTDSNGNRVMDIDGNDDLFSDTASEQMCGYIDSASKSIKYADCSATKYTLCLNKDFTVEQYTRRTAAPTTTPTAAPTVSPAPTTAAPTPAPYFARYEEAGHEYVVPRVPTPSTVELRNSKGFGDLVMGTFAEANTTCRDLNMTMAEFYSRTSMEKVALSLQQEISRNEFPWVSYKSDNVGYGYSVGAMPFRSEFETERGFTTSNECGELDVRGNGEAIGVQGRDCTLEKPVLCFRRIETASTPAPAPTPAAREPVVLETTTIDNVTYNVYELKTTWEKAELFCSGKDMELAQIRDPERMFALATVLNASDALVETSYVTDDAPTTRYPWIGYYVNSNNQIKSAGEWTLPYGMVSSDSATKSSNECASLDMVFPNGTSVNADSSYSQTSFGVFYTECEYERYVMCSVQVGVTAAPTPAPTATPTAAPVETPIATAESHGFDYAVYDQKTAFTGAYSHCASRYMRVAGFQNRSHLEDVAGQLATQLSSDEFPWVAYKTNVIGYPMKDNEDSDYASTFAWKDELEEMNSTGFAESRYPNMGGVLDFRQDHLGVQALSTIVQKYVLCSKFTGNGTEPSTEDTRGDQKIVDVISQGVHYKGYGGKATSTWSEAELFCVDRGMILADLYREEQATQDIYNSVSAQEQTSNYRMWMGARTDRYGKGYGTNELRYRFSSNVTEGVANRCAQLESTTYPSGLQTMLDFKDCGDEAFPLCSKIVGPVPYKWPENFLAETVADGQLFRVYAADVFPNETDARCAFDDMKTAQFLSRSQMDKVASGLRLKLSSENFPLVDYRVNSAGKPESTGDRAFTADLVEPSSKFDMPNSCAQFDFRGSTDVGIQSVSCDEKRVFMCAGEASLSTTPTAPTAPTPVPTPSAAPSTVPTDAPTEESSAVALQLSLVALSAVLMALL